MRRMTEQHMREAFLTPDIDSVSLSTFWVIINRAKNERGIDLRQALERVRRQTLEVSIFVEKILRPEDLDDVVYVIDKLAAEVKQTDVWSLQCLRMLQSWRARMLMQIVIERRRSAQMSSRTNIEDQR